MSDKVEYTGAPEVGPKLNLSSGYGINAPAEAFGTSLFSAIHGLGEVGEQAALKKQALANDLEHNDRALDVSDQTSKEWETMGNKEGKAAVNYLGTYKNNLRRIYEDAIKNAPNDEVRKQLSQSAFRDIDRQMMHGTNYAETQLRKWHDETHDRAIKTTINQAELNRRQPDDDIHQMIHNGVNGIGGANSVRDRMLSKGWNYGTPEGKAAIDSAVEDYNGQAYGSIVKALVDDGDVRRADRIFQQARSSMDAKSQNTIDAILKPKRDAIEAQGVADHVLRREGRGESIPANSQQAIDRAAAATGVDAGMLKTFARIESSGNPNAVTGKYKGLFQLSDTEFAKHGGGDIFDANHNAMAAARKLKKESADFKARTGREPSGFDLYMVHQQGAGGAANHAAHPQDPAWRNMLDTAEGASKGAGWAKQAIWGNIPSDQKARFPSGVESVTSGQFMDLWRDKYTRLGGQDAGQRAQPTADQQQPPATPGTQGEADLAAGPLRPTLAAKDALYAREAANIGKTYDTSARDSYASLPDKGAVMANAVEEARRRWPDNPNMQNAVLAKVREAYSIKQADAADEARAEKEHKEALHQDMLKAEDEYIRDALGGNPKRSAKDILADPRLAVDPSKREHLIKLYAGDGDGVDKDSSAKKTRELSRLMSDESDPHHISDLGGINAAYYGGQITRTDWDRLTKEFKENRTEDGNSFLKSKNKFYEAAKTQIIKPVVGMPYPPSSMQFFEYTRAIDAKIDRLRKAGESPDNIEKLFTSAPGGFADPEFMKQYQADTKQAIDYQSSQLKQRVAPKLAPEKSKEMWEILRGSR